MAPKATRGQGTGGTPMHGAPHASARRTSSPPPAITTILAPARAASVAASTVSSVAPEHETAKTRDASSTKFGHS